MVDSKALGCGCVVNNQLVYQDWDMLLCGLRQFFFIYSDMFLERCLRLKLPDLL